MQSRAHVAISPPPDAERKASPREGRLGASILRWAHGGSVQKVRLIRQYAAACLVFVGALVLDGWLDDLIGYEAIALVFLLIVVVFAFFAERGPIILCTTLTAIAWGFIAPPRYTIAISNSYDQMMLVTYFVVALTVGHLTTRLRAMREAEIKSKLLTESERLGRTLLNSVSHEFRTPIAAIMTATSSLKESGSLTPMQQKLTIEIESAGTRLNRVVRSLLSAARVQSGQVQPKMDWCDVTDLVRVALVEAAPLTATHTVREQLEAGLPLVKLDFVLMEQALVNLLANAAMHTPPGTQIEISARREDKELILSVTDNGPGLPADETQRIFDMFHRAPQARPGGTGLGLAIVKGFVEAQGGGVTASNRPGGGAIFTIRLPVSAVPKLPDETI